MEALADRVAAAARDPAIGQLT